MVTLINRENVPWLVAHYGATWPFDMVVIDELSSFKKPPCKALHDPGEDAALCKPLGWVNRNPSL